MIVNTQTLSGLVMLLQGIVGDDIRVALYDSEAKLDSSTTVYTSVGEVRGPGYTAGGKSMTNARLAHSGKAIVLDFDDPVWTNSTLSARGALIYNKTRGSCAMCVLDFGEVVSSKNGNFRLPLPEPTEQDGIYRLVLGG